ncbi:WD40/YVTN/BNR-like repeat-containing protein [Streptomyces scopuliridis]|uniref:Oxidoreductase n=1 Tax=Streptomyces scopuliridis RB72 TaxID=1440053 RepID=A0A2T7TBT8_9ACTN|nr:oxidoreductase [Streptomyces scopuliridis]PVE12613.1 oxidoreductase [Streptomyces scopuliridis RB72]
MGKTGKSRKPGKTRRVWWAGLAVAVSAATLATALAVPAQADGTDGGGRPGDRPGAGTPGWHLTDTGSDARFRGLAAVSRRAAWVAGSGGTVLRTADGGRSWRDVSPAVADELEFRDIEAFDGRRAVALAIGEGEASRIYRTEDGGAHWTESFRNTDPRAFYDCVTFFDSRHGLAMSDPVDGKFRILSTGDGGSTWRVLPSDGMPAALPGEAGFAAGGQCLVSSGPKDVWLATGGGATARVLHSADRGVHWTVTDSALPGGDPARGVFGLAFRDRRHGLAVGGDYRADQVSPRAAAVSGDGGRSWRQANTPPPAYRSGVAWLPHSRSAALAVGPTGTDLTTDGGRNWRTIDTGSYDTVDCTPDLGCWAAGERGRVARLDLLVQDVPDLLIGASNPA